ncbi:rCG52268 [Rattus norvegicus]|uniref:RCG52268 n=1 Tax=Rattus norvegicus TaxID=10116 RepID=A6K0J6_RAT|nr:rCG52268 [Rattus norvegicus]
MMRSAAAASTPKIILGIPLWSSRILFRMIQTLKIRIWWPGSQWASATSPVLRIVPT